MEVSYSFGGPGHHRLKETFVIRKFQAKLVK